MAHQVAVVARVHGIQQADAGTYLAQALEFVRLISNDLGARAELVSVTKSNSHLVPDVYASATAGATTYPSTGRAGVITHVNATIAGAAAGDHTVTGIKTTDELVAVVHVDDTTHAGTDKTSEYTISAADTINNTGGTASTGAHVVVAYRRV